jgi:drug/metabolite transporter (DMT)-like permease
MNLVAVLMVLASAGLHLGWNASTRRNQGDPGAVWAMVATAGVLSGLAAGRQWGMVPWTRAWPWILATVMIHSVYYPALAAVYRHQELGQGYPLARGGAAVPAALVAWWWRHQALSLPEGLGVALVVGGVLLMQAHRAELSGRRFIPLGLVVLAITGYSVVDSYAARFVPALPYMACLAGGTALILWPWARPRTVWTGWGTVAAGAETAASYVLMLLAYPMAPLAPLMAIRQVAPALAPVWGWLSLKERWSWTRIAGSVAVAVGAALLVG